MSGVIVFANDTRRKGLEMMDRKIKMIGFGMGGEYTQERFSKIKEVTYLATDKRATYRAILRHFYLQHERMKEFLLPQEVFEHIKNSSYFEDYTIDELHIDLAVLVKWENFNAQQERGNAKTIEGFK